MGLSAGVHFEILSVARPTSMASRLAGTNNLNAPVFHKRSGGLALLKEIQAFWEEFDGPIEKSQIDNPYAQPRASNIAMDFRVEKAIAKHQAKKLEGECMNLQP